MKKILVAVAVSLCTTWVQAAEVLVSDAWIRASAPGQQNAAAQLVITAPKDAALVGVTSDVAKHVALHSMAMEGNVMKMRTVRSVPLPGKQAVSLAEDGYHIMLMGLHQPLVAGETVPLTLRLRFADGGRASVKLDAQVRALTATQHEAHDHEASHHH